MSIEEIAAQALAERTERRKVWLLYQRASLHELEALLTATNDPSQKESLQEYLALFKRELKATFEGHEKRGDFREKASLPIAVSIVSFGAWAVGLGWLPPAWKPWALLAFNVVAAGVWLVVRRSGFRVILEARRQLALLGKVD